MVLEVGIKADIKGGESLSKLAKDIRGVQKATDELASRRSSYFQHLKRDAEAYSGNLKDQIRYIREQIGLDRQRSTEGHRARMLELKGDTLRRSTEMRSHLEMRGEGTAAREELVDWVRAQSMGVSPDAGGFAQGRARGMLAKARGIGLVKGGGIALAGYAGYKAVSALTQGFGEFKSLEQSLVNIYGLMRKIPEDTSRFRRDLELAAFASGVMGKNFAGMSANWMTLANAPSPNLSLLETNMRTGRAYGISTDFSATYGARLARMGYWKMPRNLPSGILGAGILARQTAGLSDARSQEFLELIQSVMGAVAGTAGAADISRIMAITANVAKLGEPFQRERGAQFIAGLHGGLTRGGGYGITYLAAQQALYKKTGKMPSYGEVEMYRAGGLNQEGYLEEVYGISKSIFRGADPETQAVMFAKSVGLTDYRRFHKALPFFESGDIAAGRDIILGEMRKPDFRKKFQEYGGFKMPPKKSDISGFMLPPGQASLVPKTETDRRMTEIESTFGWKSMRSDIGLEILKIEASATLFKEGANIFYQGVENMVENVLAAPQGVSEIEDGVRLSRLTKRLRAYEQKQKYREQDIDN